MTMNRDKGLNGITPSSLEDLFAEIASAPVAVPESLMARVLADAERLQPAAPAFGAGKGAAASSSSSGGWLAALSALFGGGASLAGLGLAGAAGLWIGFAQPFDIDLGLGLQAGTLETLDLFPADLDQWSEALAPDLLSDD